MRVVLLALAETLAWAGTYYLFPAVLTHVEREDEWDRAPLAAAYTLALLINAAAAPLAGRLVDVGLGRMLLTASSACAGAVVLLLSLNAHDLPSFYAAWLFIGLTMAGCLYEPCFAFVTKELPDAKDSITTITLIAGFAGTISFPACQAIAAAAGWRSAARALGATLMVVAAPLFWFGASGAAPTASVQHRIATHTRQVDRTRRPAVCSRPTFWLLTITYTSCALATGTIVNHLLPLAAELGIAPRYAVGAAMSLGPSQVASRAAIALARRLQYDVPMERVLAGALITLMMAVALLALSVHASGSRGMGDGGAGGAGAGGGGAGIARAGSGGGGGSSSEGGGSLVTAMLYVSAVLYGSAAGTFSIARPVVTARFLGKEGFGAISGALAVPATCGIALGPTLAAALWRLGGYGLVLRALFGVLVVGLAALLVLLCREGPAARPSAIDRHLQYGRQYGRMGSVELTSAAGAALQSGAIVREREPG